MPIENPTNAATAVEDAVSTIRGAAEALSLRAAVEGGDLDGALCKLLDSQARELGEVAAWLESSQVRL